MLTTADRIRRLVDPDHPTTTPLLVEVDGKWRLRPLLGFDYEGHLIRDGLRTPRAVCMSVWLREDNSLQAPLHLQEDGALVLPGQNSVALHHARTVDHAHFSDVGGIASPADSVRALMAVLDMPGDAPTSPLLIAQNNMFDVSTSIVTAERLTLMGALPPGTGRHLRALWLEAFVAGRVLDPVERDKLIFIAAGAVDDNNNCMDPLAIKRGALSWSLAHTIKRRFSWASTGLPVDLSADKQESVCTTCGGTGEASLSERLRARKENREPGPCPDCKGTGTYVPWRMRYRELEDVPIEDWPKRAVDYSIEDSKWVVDAVVDQGDLHAVYGDRSLLCALGRGSTQPPGDLGEGYRLSDSLLGNPHVVSPRGGIIDELPQQRSKPGFDWQTVWSLRTDRERGEAWGLEVTRGMRQQALHGLKEGFVRLDGTQDKKALQACVEAAYWEKGESAPRTEESKTFPDGQTKTDGDTLLHSGDEGLVTYARFGTAKKNATTFYPLVQSGYHHPIRYRIDVLKRTGRTSASAGMHQPPRGGGYRGCYEPRPGHVYLSADWSGAEMVGLAQTLLNMFGSSKMADLLNEGYDLHTYMARHLYNAWYGGSLSYSDAERAYRDSNHPLHKIFKGDPNAPEGTIEYIGLRQFGKVPDFGLPGGLGPGEEGDPSKGLVAYARQMAGIIITVDQAREVKEIYTHAFPEMKDYYNIVGGWASDGSFPYECWVSGRKRGGSMYCDGCNAGFQPLVAEALKLWVYLTTLAAYHPEGAVALAAEEGTVAPINRKGGTGLWASKGCVVWGGFDAPGRPYRRLPTFELVGERSPLYGARNNLSIHDELFWELPYDEEARGVFGAGYEGVRGGSPRIATDMALEVSRLGEAALAAFCPDMAKAVEAEPAICRRWAKGMGTVWASGGKKMAGPDDVLLPWEPKGGW